MRNKVDTTRNLETVMFSVVLIFAIAAGLAMWSEPAPDLEVQWAGTIYSLTAIAALGMSGCAYLIYKEDALAHSRGP